MHFPFGCVSSSQDIPCITSAVDTASY